MSEVLPDFSHNVLGIKAIGWLMLDEVRRIAAAELDEATTWISA